VVELAALYEVAFVTETSDPPARGEIPRDLGATWE